MENGPSEPAALDLLRLARGHLRSRTRTPAYFERGDRFAVLFLGKPLGVPVEYSKSLATDLAVVLDTLYEDFLQRAPGRAPLLREATRHLQGFVSASVAISALPHLRARLDATSCPLLDVASALLAALTAVGYESLTRRTSAEVADDWLELWKAAVAAHNHQQELHSGLCLLQASSPADRQDLSRALDIPEPSLRPGGGTFWAGARRYLEMFSESGAAAMVLVGALPFAQKPTPDGLRAMVAFLRATPELLAWIGGVLRLAQDVKFDPSEPVSTGVFALAAERNASIVDVDASRLAATDIEEKLKAVWDRYDEESRGRMDTLMAGLNGEDPIRPVISEIVEVTRMIARSLVGSG